jgi:hypothetical protein
MRVASTWRRAAGARRWSCSGRPWPFPNASRGAGGGSLSGRRRNGRPGSGATDTPRRRATLRAPSHSCAGGRTSSGGARRRFAEPGVGPRVRGGHGGGQRGSIPLSRSHNSPGVYCVEGEFVLQNRLWRIKVLLSGARVPFQALSPPGPSTQSYYHLQSHGRPTRLL